MVGLGIAKGAIALVSAGGSLVVEFYWRDLFREVVLMGIVCRLSVTKLAVRCFSEFFMCSRDGNLDKFTVGPFSCL